MKLKLEVGKTYEVRRPDLIEADGLPTHVKIVGKRKGSNWFIGDDGDDYLQSGHFNSASNPCELDLVKEVEP